MSFTLYDASAPVFTRAMTNMAAWLDKAAAEGKDEAALMTAALAPDMRPFPAQIQMASDTAKSSIARLTGIAAPSMADTESTIADLKDRCLATIAYIDSIAASAFDGAEAREIVLTFQAGMGYRLSGGDYLTRFALPNFFFHVTTAYAILRANGVGLGKADFLQHMGMPAKLDAAA